MTRLSLIDGGFLLTESHHSPKHVAALLVFRLPNGKGKAWLRSMLDEMKQWPPCFPFNQKLKDNPGPLYELEPDRHLEIDYHVRHTVLPSPGSDSQMLDVVARMHANLLDRDRPLWEFHLIEGLSDRRFAFYIKIHHALADGITIGRWLGDCGATSADQLDTPPIWAHEENSGDREESGISYREMLFNGVKLLGGGVKTALGVATLSAKILQRRFLDGDSSIALPFSAPKTTINVTPGAARKISIASFPLASVKAIGKTLGGSINDVLMTMCDVAISRYFDSHEDTPDGPLVAYMPVNIRTSEDEGDGNLVTLLQVKLASNHADPIDSFHEVRESIISAREVYSGVPRDAVQYYALMVALVSLAEEMLGLHRLFRPVENLVISNVPGPREKYFFRGAEEIGLYPVSTLPPMTALNVTVCSYHGTLFFGLIAGRTAVPDLDILTTYLEDAFHDLADATGVSVDQ
ncbi:MAG: wax ester/triacylglycerol synthase family O-acyltransferase [Xanthomonadales bacterium]|nr:wax ester/triacylglycerol synthase family O-acyltransferase [Gammaproteobacteria bacterium]NND56888.1 wax ester/triacylglycerol synthase family O-acyltransferase [Xanthomonadales bacterium]